MRKLTGFADEATNGIEGQVAVLKQLGWNAIELRAVDSTLAHNLPEDEFSRVADYLEEQGIAVACLGSGIANWSIPITQPFDETKKVVHRTITRMKRLHTRYVRIMSFKVNQDAEGRILEDQMVDERIRRMNWICQSFIDEGLVPVHENCHTYGGLSYEHTLFLLDKVPGLKLVFDTGNPPITADGRRDFPYPFQDSYEFFSHVKDHIVHVHIKDAVMDSDGKTEHYHYPGEGAGQVKRIVSELQQDGYDGYYSIEPHMEVVFHNAAAESTEARRIANFIEYGKRFERLLEEV